MKGHSSCKTPSAALILKGEKKILPQCRISGQGNITSHRHKLSAKPHGQRARAVGEPQHSVGSSCFLQIMRLPDNTPTAQGILIYTQPKLSEEASEIEYRLKPCLIIMRTNLHSPMQGTALRRCQLPSGHLNPPQQCTSATRRVEIRRVAFLLRKTADL